MILDNNTGDCDPINCGESKTFQYSLKNKEKSWLVGQDGGVSIDDHVGF